MAFGLPVRYRLRMPAGGLSVAGLAGVVIACVLLFADLFLGHESTDNENWIGGRPGQDPAVRDRQAGDRAVGRPCLRAQGARLDSRPPDADAGRARRRRWPRRCVLGGHDLGTALVFVAILLGVLWVVGAPDAVRIALSVVGSRCCSLRQHRHERLGRSDQLRGTRSRTSTDRLAGRPRTLRAQLRRLVEGIGASQAEVGLPARGAHRLHLRRAGRGAGPARRAGGDRAVRAPSRSARCASPTAPGPLRDAARAGLHLPDS